MTGILVLGGGQQGRVVATELSKRHRVIVGDQNLVHTNHFDSAIVDATVPETYRAGSGMLAVLCRYCTR